MAIGFSDLLSFAGQVFGAKSGQEAQLGAARISAATADKDRAAREARINAGTVDALGNVINRLDPDTGALTTSLAPGSQRLSDAILGSQTSSADVRGQFGDVASTAVGDFAGFTAAGGRPDFSLGDATSIIEADTNRLKNAILNPALANAQATDIRQLGGTSNAGNIVSRFQERILPQIQLGGEQEALNLKAQQDEQFIRNSLGIGVTALGAASGGPQVNLPGVLDANALANLINTIPKPADEQIDFGGQVIGGGIEAFGDLFRADALAGIEAEDKNRLFKILEARLGNQGLV